MGISIGIEHIIGQVKDLFSKSLAEVAAPVGSLGVDIGSHSVKMVRLESSKEGHKVLGFAVEKVPDKNYRDALSKALVKTKAPLGQGAVISVAGQGVVSRYIELPLMNKTELESSMKFEIEKYVPFSLAEVSSDYAVVGEMKDKAKMSVLVAAAKNDLIQKKCDLAKEVNLNLKAIDLDCLALANFFMQISGLAKKGTCLGVINIGKSVSNINILVDGAPCLSRDIFIGGDDITKKMAEVMEINYTDAEKMKLEPGSKKDELLSIWDPVLNNLAAEIRVSLDYFEARNNKAVEMMFITGGASRLFGIEEYLKRLLSVEIKRLDYCSQLKYEAGLSQEEFAKDSDLLAVALGLALR
ncbi:MAG: hypothetical protein AUJ74_05055 [Candidatus Omnitrophica bacterium CG1_02_44_16]|nr:MAG: hypothetical protein AUJ74_05055 [Candidatus Omnitrophica bacterium CG1_02_44_16]PIY83700.1 MAG: hypothetical protein COY78_01585 [Candidatus Omnitrophica bacterium CG_4_10_14_0_8_um_filter_44_12]PIZ84411.1 MAG: hypothetical protein COX96_04055 [Candidatus Omnitrophica bacterium CG_4_10_14_0_2_um_filter_44_9]